MNAKALVIGEALVDLVQGVSGELTAHPGGSPANVALGLARLGREVELLTTLGADDHGSLVRGHLETSGVEVVTGTPAQRTSTALARLDDAGVATYEFDLDWRLAPDATVDAQPIVVHTGSISATLMPGAGQVLEMFKSAKEHATLSYDPNARPALMGSPALAREAIERFVALADVIKVSDEDLGWLYPDSNPHDIARSWHKAGAAIVIVTHGGDGAFAVAASGELTMPSAKVTVVDTVGAGDSFMGGLIDGLWSACLLGAPRREALKAIDQETLAGIVKRCVAIAGITVSRAGANPPNLAELGELS